MVRTSLYDPAAAEGATNTALSPATLLARCRCRPLRVARTSVGVDGPSRRTVPGYGCLAPSAGQAPARPAPGDLTLAATVLDVLYLGDSCASSVQPAGEVVIRADPEEAAGVTIGQELTLGFAAEDAVAGGAAVEDRDGARRDGDRRRAALAHMDAYGQSTTWLLTIWRSARRRDSRGSCARQPGRGRLRGGAGRYQLPAGIAVAGGPVVVSCAVTTVGGTIARTRETIHTAAGHLPPRPRPWCNSTARHAARGRDG